ncbi:hypothetical protein RBB50_012413 [Rhinocladiella similis]
MAPHEAPKPSASKTKQERIRDNQRRSRARRAEYLAELERRLKECHGVCRDADLQRLAFADLQAENSRLRNLLSSAGLDPDAAGSFSQVAVHCPHRSTTASSTRGLKPKLQHTDTQQRSAMTQHKQEYERSSCPIPLLSLSDASQTTTFPEPCLLYDTYGNYPLALNDSSLAPTPPSVIKTSSAPSYDCLLGSDGTRSHATSESGLSADIFPDPCALRLLPTSEGSFAKTMADQYDPALSEMGEIQARGYRSFGQSTFSYTDRQVSSQVLFQLLNEMDSR